MQATDDIVYMQQTVGAQNSKMRVMVSDVRSLLHLQTLARLGCNTFSVSPTIAHEMLTNEHTEVLNEELQEAARALW